MIHVDLLGRPKRAERGGGGRGGDMNQRLRQSPLDP